MCFEAQKLWNVWSCTFSIPSPATRRLFYFFKTTLYWQPWSVVSSSFQYILIESWALKISLSRTRQCSFIDIGWSESGRPQTFHRKSVCYFQASRDVGDVRSPYKVTFLQLPAPKRRIRKIATRGIFVSATLNTSQMFLRFKALLRSSFGQKYCPKKGTQISLT